MIALKDNRISMYEGDYRPVETMRNGQKLAGWKRVGMTGSEGEFTGTYNDALTVYGKSGYRESRNLCPPPEAKTMNDGIIEVVLEPTANGRFDLSSRTVSNDVAMMMSPNIIHSVTLSAGTYAASSNSAVLGLSMGDEMVYSLPHTFTLETDQTVYFGTYSTDFAETDLYLQIESGESVTDYDPYAGDPTKEPSPDNIRPLVSSAGTITVQGKNLLDGSTPMAASTVGGLKIQYEGNGIFHVFGRAVANSGGDLGYMRIDVPCRAKSYTLTAEIISGSPGARGLIPYLGVGESPGERKNWLCVEFSPEDSVGTTRSVTRSTNSENIPVNYITYFWVFFWNIGGDEFDVDCRMRIWLEEGDKSSPFVPFYLGGSYTIPKLKGVAVSSDFEWNYAETENGSTNHYKSDILCKEGIIHYVEEVTLNGSEMFYKAADQWEKTYRYYWDTTQGLKSAQKAAAGLCNALKTLKDIHLDEEGVLFGAQDTRIYLCLNKKRFPDVQSVSSWLSEQARCGEPVMVQYILDMPYTEKVDNKQIPKTLPRFAKITKEDPYAYPTLGMESCVKVEC